MTSSQPTSAIEDDELDVLLDNALDDFTATQLDASIAATSTDALPFSAIPAGKENSSSAKTKGDGDVALDDDFAKQLAAGMEELVQGMGGDGEEFQKAMEQMIKQLEVDSQPKGEGSTSNPPTSSGGTFQDKVTDTLNKLKSSSSQVKAELAEESADELLAEMMRQMGELSESGDMANVIEGMMEQLMSKDILYEPMKDLAAKYPEWLKQNDGKILPDEKARYEKQYLCITQILEHYDRPGFDEATASAEDTKKIIELMQEMQECGQPPAEVLKDLAPGLELGDDGQPKMPEMGECSIM